MTDTFVRVAPDSTGARIDAVWVPIDEAQAPGWQGIANAQTPTWQTLPTTQAPVWAPVTT